MTTILRNAFAAALLVASFPARAASDPSGALPSWTGNIPATQDASGAVTAATDADAPRGVVLSSWSGRIPADPTATGGGIESVDGPPSGALSSWAGIITTLPELVGSGAAEPEMSRR